MTAGGRYMNEETRQTDFWMSTALSSEAKI